MTRRVRRLRHWKQQYAPDAEFIWRKVITWDGERTVTGEKIPGSLKANRTKLKRFWEAQAIELAEFEAPDVVTGQVPEPTEEPTEEGRTPEDLVSKIKDRKWHVLGIVSKTYLTKRAALEAAEQYLVSAKATEAPMASGEEFEAQYDEDDNTFLD